MNQIDEYKSVMSEIIGKQIVILGPEIAVLRARKVPEISLSEDGKVVDVKGDPDEVLNRLIDTYVELSGEIVTNALGTIFTKYPSIKRAA
ncbi:MAG: hypothetical protein AAB552_01620 [Patescibacteria group bacterium]